VGVVPVGMLASVLHSDWSTLFELVMGVVLTYSARSFSLFLGKKVDEARESQVRSL
jgi:hypothetical protein